MFFLFLPSFWLISRNCPSFLPRFFFLLPVLAFIHFSLPFLFFFSSTARSLHFLCFLRGLSLSRWMAATAGQEACGYERWLDRLGAMRTARAVGFAASIGILGRVRRTGKGHVDEGTTGRGDG